jgi:hypothetical protein
LRPKKTTDAKTYEATFRTDPWVRTQVTAASSEEAKLTDVVKLDVDRPLDILDTPSHVLEVLQSEFFGAEEMNP